MHVWWVSGRLGDYVRSGDLIGCVERDEGAVEFVQLVDVGRKGRVGGGDGFGGGVDGEGELGEGFDVHGCGRSCEMFTGQSVFGH